MKPKVNKAKTNRGTGGVPFAMPKNKGDGGVGPDVMGSMGMGAGMKKGGKVKKYARGGGIEQKGKTKGKFV